MSTGKATAILMLCMACGCRTTPAPRPPANGAAYKGNPAIEQPVRIEMVRQLILVGLDPQEGWDHKFTGVRVDPTGRNYDGYYGPLDSGNSVHGAFRGRKGSQWSTLWFAFPADGKPDAPTVSHEVCHWLLKYNEGVGGHPETATVNGKLWNVHDIIKPEARWPMRAWTATKRVATFWRDKGFTEEINGEYINHGEKDNAHDRRN